MSQANTKLPRKELILPHCKYWRRKKFCNIDIDTLSLPPIRNTADWPNDRDTKKKRKRFWKPLFFWPNLRKFNTGFAKHITQTWNQIYYTKSIYYFFIIWSLKTMSCLEPENKRFYLPTTNLIFLKRCHYTITILERLLIWTSKNTLYSRLWKQVLALHSLDILSYIRVKVLILLF